MAASVSTALSRAIEADSRSPTPQPACTARSV